MPLNSKSDAIAGGTLPLCRNLFRSMEGRKEGYIWEGRNLSNPEYGPVGDMSALASEKEMARSRRRWPDSMTSLPCKKVNVHAAGNNMSACKIQRIDLLLIILAFAG
ncbi:hypothetical protein RHMOL_Rhmol13G0183700 [Rhododendron molle]|uniref:Uncharacterized protein n=1 Tax=Rhododendron molle TaxID=49168 RepID=A0ACC0L919_RHOML|nr:hypothetical protein RHMOL_Rhmol13G0183700 [Rhododendron molle]